VGVIDGNEWITVRVGDEDGTSGRPSQLFGISCGFAAVISIEEIVLYGL